MNNKKNISNLKKCPICKSIKNTKIYGKVRGSGNTTDFELKNKLVNMDVVLCKNCGFLFLKELMSDIEQKHFFNHKYKESYKKKLSKNIANRLKKMRYIENISYAKNYIGKKTFLTNESLSISETQSEIVINILLKFKGLENKSILDVGCGGGGFLKQIKRFNMNKIVGIEPSKTHIQNLQKKPDSKIKIYRGMIEEFTKEEIGTFDIIVLNGVIKHFNYPVKNLQYCCNLLKKDGIICFNNGLEEPNLMINLKKRFSIVAQNYFTYKTYQYLFKKCNLKILYFQNNLQFADFVLKKSEVSETSKNDFSINNRDYLFLRIKYFINILTPDFIFSLTNIVRKIKNKLIKKNINIRYSSFKKSIR